MNEKIPPMIEKVRQYQGVAMPAVDPGDLRTLYEYGRAKSEEVGGAVSVDYRVFERICSAGADTFAVWYRGTILCLSLGMMAHPIPDLWREKFPPGTELPEHLIEAPEWMREDLKRTPLPDYVFEVFARFPMKGIPGGGIKGLPMDYGALIAELERARGAAEG